MPHPPVFADPVQLQHLTRFYAAEVRRGAYPYVVFDAEHRWHQRLYRDRRFDIWLISWLPEQGTQLHDHGGSSGSFTVISGELTETVVSAHALHDHTRMTGDSVGFGPHYVHDVRNTSAAPAVSVHAYSPPLTTMTYYDLVAGRCEPIASLATDDPEPVFEAATARVAS